MVALFYAGGKDFGEYEMAAQLEIRDGSPWWLSPDLWVVPGNDPLGPPGIPTAGSPAYMWARVRNNGDSPATNAEVRFYWADPSTAFDRTTANPVGSAFVSLDAGEVADVLLLVPWVPEFVNNGHECILAEAFHALLDPLPTSPAFNVPTDRHVAQRNLSVAKAAADGFFAFSLIQVNTSRLTGAFRLVAEPAPIAALKPLLEPMALKLDVGGDAGRLKRFGFVDAACPQPENLKRKQKPDITFEIPAKGRTRRSLIGQLSGGPALIHIKQYHGDRLIGGQSLLVLPEAGGAKSKSKSNKNPGRSATS
jgi:hypothetical protein